MYLELNVGRRIFNPKEGNKNLCYRYSLKIKREGFSDFKTPLMRHNFSFKQNS